MCFSCVCIRGMSYTVWEQVPPLYRKDIRNRECVGGEGDRQRRVGGLSGKEGNEKRTPSTFHSHNKTPPYAPSPFCPRRRPPPLSTSVKCPSSTISALQRSTTTNSASLTSHKKTFLPVCVCVLSTYSRRFSLDLKCVLGQTVCYGRGPLCV